MRPPNSAELASKATDPLANAPGRSVFLACVVLATLMQALDTTIANVALPYMQGELSASQGEIAWVLTSYIIAAAIMTPPSGFLAGRFGIKNVFLVSIAGFTAASLLCGLAQSLTQIVIFRVLQGLFGAALVPLAQTTMLRATPPEHYGRTMGMFGVAVMTGPVLGPVLGGWLTANFSWRYVFFINLPIGALAFLGILRAMPETERDHSKRLDWFGFIALSVSIAALQVMLDRGEEKDWFSSPEIVIEAVVAVVAFALFLVQIFTSANPFVRPALFKNRNFSAGTVFIAIVGLTYYSSLALQPTFIQGLMGYPVLTSGLVMGPRGLGTMVAMQAVGRLVGKVETRLLLAIGLALTSWSFYAMTGWTTDVTQPSIVIVGVIQGMGLGFIFVPLSAVSLSTLSAQQMAQGAGIYSLSRNIGSSIGISLVNSLLVQNTQINYTQLGQFITAFNPVLQNPALAAFWNPFSAAGRAALNEVVIQQAQVIAYIDDYKILMWMTMAAIPLLIVFRKTAVLKNDEAVMEADHI